MLIRYRKHLFVLFMLFLVLLPIFSTDAAGIVPCGRRVDDPSTPENESTACTLCHFIIGIKYIVDYGSKILVVTSVTAIFLAGIMYIISAGSEESMKKAKSFLGASIVGFAIVTTGWFIVNVTMWVLSVNMTSISKVNWYTFTCETQSSSTGATTKTNDQTYPENVSNSDFTFDPNVASQTKDESSQLASLLNCMKSKLPNGAKRISSISDSAGMNNCLISKWGSQCAHTKYSCHYGGRTCQGKSYAADFGNEKYGNEIMSAAKSCGGTAINESNHIHVSIGSCGCDGN